MDVREAAQHARAHIASLFEGENIMNLGLEEVEFDEVGNSWIVTIGFSRAWDMADVATSLLGVGVSKNVPRSYKTVRIRDADKQVLSVRNRW